MSDKLSAREAVEEIQVAANSINSYADFGRAVYEILSRVSDEAPTQESVEELARWLEEVWDAEKGNETLGMCCMRLARAVLARFGKPQPVRHCTCCATSKCNPECGCWSQG